jgi:hypothetical protein
MIQCLEAAAAAEMQPLVLCADCRDNSWLRRSLWKRG